MIEADTWDWVSFILSESFLCIQSLKAVRDVVPGSTSEYGGGNYLEEYNLISCDWPFIKKGL